MKTKSKLVLGLSILSAATLAAGATSTFAWYTSAFGGNSVGDSIVLGFAETATADSTALAIESTKVVKFLSNPGDEITLSSSTKLIPATTATGATAAARAAGDQIAPAKDLSTFKSYVMQGLTAVEDVNGETSNYAAVHFHLALTSTATQTNYNYKVTAKFNNLGTWDHDGDAGEESPTAEVAKVIREQWCFAYRIDDDTANDNTNNAYVLDNGTAVGSDIVLESNITSSTAASRYYDVVVWVNGKNVNANEHPPLEALTGMITFTVSMN